MYCFELWWKEIKRKVIKENSKKFAELCEYQYRQHYCVENDDTWRQANTLMVGLFISSLPQPYKNWSSERNGHYHLSLWKCKEDELKSKETINYFTLLYSSVIWLKVCIWIVIPEAWHHIERRLTSKYAAYMTRFFALGSRGAAWVSVT